MFVNACLSLPAKSPTVVYTTRAPSHYSQPVCLVLSSRSSRVLAAGLCRGSPRRLPCHDFQGSSGEPTRTDFDLPPGSSAPVSRYSPAGARPERRVFLIPSHCRVVFWVHRSTPPPPPLLLASQSHAKDPAKQQHLSAYLAPKYAWSTPPLPLPAPPPPLRTLRYLANLVPLAAVPCAPILGVPCL